MIEKDLENFLQDLGNFGLIDRKTLRVNEVPTKDGFLTRIEAKYTGKKEIPQIRTDREAIPYEEDIARKKEFAESIFGMVSNLTEGSFSNINRSYFQQGISAEYSDQNLKGIEVIFY